MTLVLNRVDRVERRVFPMLSPAVGFVLLTDFDEGGQIAAPSAQAWESAVPDLLGQRLAGVALRLIRDRELAVPPAVVNILRRAAFAESVATGLVTHFAPEALKLLGDARIRTVVLKGPGLVPERGPQERPFSDLDILVSPADFSRSLVILRGAGFREATATSQPRDWCNRLCREAINLKRPDGASIDLHHHVPPWFWGRALTFDRLWIHSEQLMIEDVSCQVPSPAHRVVLACFHVISDHSRPGETVRVWRDILMTLTAANADELVDEVVRLRVGIWVRWVVGQLPPPVRPVGLLQALGPGRLRAASHLRMHHLLNNDEGRSETLVHLSRIPWPNGLLYLFALAMPSSEFLYGRYGRHRRRLHWIIGKRPRVVLEKR